MDDEHDNPHISLQSPAITVLVKDYAAIKALLASLESNLYGLHVKPFQIDTDALIAAIRSMLAVMDTNP